MTDTTQPMPAFFVGHGSPMNALETNRYTRTWQALGASMPRPRAILMVSAHWYVNATTVTAMAHPKTIHDFYGFPQPLFEVQYPAPGLPELAEEVADIVQPDEVGADHDSWGLDHGAWSVLVHAFPEADIPVVQLSINAARAADYHLQLGAKLAVLRERGVLVIGSGNIVHNLRAMDWQAQDAGFDWARRFNEKAIAVATSAPERAVALAQDADFAMAAPTPEHFLPFLYVAGFGVQIGEPLRMVIDGYTYGSLSMTCFVTGAPCPEIERVPHANPATASRLPQAKRPDAGIAATPPILS